MDKIKYIFKNEIYKVTKLITKLFEMDKKY